MRILQNIGYIYYELGDFTNAINLYLDAPKYYEGADENFFKPLFNEDVIVGITTGLGLHLVRDIAKILQLKINITTNLEKGTTIKIIFPSV